MTSFQTSIAVRPDALGPDGSRVGHGHAPALTKANSQQNVAAVNDITITAVNSTAYTVTVGGIPVSYTSDASATVAEIYAGLEAARVVAANSFGPNSGPAKVAFSNPSAPVLRVTELDPASGLVTIAVGANLALAAVTAHSNEVSLDAGIIVVRGTNDLQCRLPSASDLIVFGLVEHQHRAAELEYADASGVKAYKPGSEIPIGTRGDYVVTVENNFAIGDAVFFRHAVGAGGSVLGRIRGTNNDSGSCTALAGAELITSGVAGGKGILRLNRP